MIRYIIISSFIGFSCFWGVASANNNLSIKHSQLTEREQSAVQYHRALNLIKDGKDIESSVVLHKVLDKDPGFVPARVSLIKLLKKIGWDKEVQDLITSGLQYDSTDKNLLLEQAELHLSQNSDEKALSSLLSIKEPDRDNRYKALLAMTYYDLELYELSQQSYMKLLQLESNNMKWWLGVALTSEELGSHKQALKAYHTILKTGGLEHSVMKYVENRAQALLEAG